MSQKEDTWKELRDQTDEFTDGLKKLLNTMKSGYIAFTDTVDKTYEEVHDTKEGEDEKLHLDEFDSKEFEKAVKTTLDVYLIQEMCNIFKLEKVVKSRVIRAFIRRHPHLREIFPRRIREQVPMPYPVSSSPPASKKGEE